MALLDDYSFKKIAKIDKNTKTKVFLKKNPTGLGTEFTSPSSLQSTNSSGGFPEIRIRDAKKVGYLVLLQLLLSTVFALLHLIVYALSPKSYEEAHSLSDILFFAYCNQIDNAYWIMPITKISQFLTIIQLWSQYILTSGFIFISVKDVISR